MLRCRPGDLAEIVVSQAGNEGRRVVVEHAAPIHLCGMHTWTVMPLQPLRMVIDATDEWGYVIHREEYLTMERVPFPDAWLRPIRPGDDDERDVATIDTGAVAHG